MFMMIAAGLAASAGIAFAAWRLRALSLSGALAAAAVGTAMFVCGTAAWYGALLLFFVSSTFLSKGKRIRKREAESGYEKGSRRDAGQVLANGGVAALVCIGHALSPSALWAYAFCGVMAAVTADTWATEIGALSKDEPRRIIGWRRVPRGTSGAVSPLGTAGAVLGAAAIGLWMAAFAWFASSAGEALPLLAAGIAGGTAGALADSLLGATVQRMRRCRACGMEVERSVHCRMPTEPIRGWRWMNNDAVNAASSVFGGLIGIAAGMLTGMLM